MTSGASQSCPGCGEPSIGPFCEQCVQSRFAATLPSQPSWCAVIAPDREYFEANDGCTEQFTFPSSSPARHVLLAGACVRIGRRSSSRGTAPEIDLAQPPADPGVSRQHAQLLAQADGTWALLDNGSTNGTYLNGATDRIPAHQQVPLSNADRIHLGVWTTITILLPDSASSAGL